uniref:Ribosome biogenesis protein NOP53 n=1 Tax=Panagrolaimus davidi TaxID=227884 RepID=A0A914QFX6_9BILA
MGRISNRRKKIKDAHIKLQEAKQAAAQAAEPEDENLNTAESADAVIKTKSKPGRKKMQKEETNLVKTRQKASVLEAKEREKEELRNRTQNSREQIAQNRKNSKKRRREIIEKVNQNFKIRKLEEKTKELQEALAAKPSTTSFDPISIVTEEDEVLALKSQPTFDVHESTRIKNVLDLTQNKYDVFRKELAKKGVESIHHKRNKLDDLVPGEGPEIDQKRNNLFLKNRAIVLHYS